MFHQSVRVVADPGAVGLREHTQRTVTQAHQTRRRPENDAGIEAVPPAVLAAVAAPEVQRVRGAIGEVRFQLHLLAGGGHDGVGQEVPRLGGAYLRARTFDADDVRGRV